MTSGTDKSALRAHLASRRDALTAVDRAATVAAILPRLTALAEWREAAIICGYIATRGELDLTPLWQAAVAAGKSYALPVTVSGAREGRMILRATSGFCPEALVPGRFGILEPPADDERFPALGGADGLCLPRPSPGPHILLILPGLGFDDEGYRLGYGGGYYDRLLAAWAAEGIPVTTVGLCHSSCRVTALPREAHDRAADILIDERSVTRP